MSAKPFVSLVISVWNRRDDLRDNLQAIQKQTRPADQVIVVDNHSHDGTPEMVQQEFPEVELICMPHSKFGACTTFNIGFKAARGDFIGILDDDVVLPETFVEQMLQEFRQEPQTTVLLSPKVIEPEMPAIRRSASPGACRAAICQVIDACPSWRRALGSDQCQMPNISRTTLMRRGF